MRQLTRKACVWAFSALFGCISLLGSGWHCFVGHQFHASADWHAVCEAQDHDLAGSHDHDEANHESHGPIASAVHDHDCPLCQFFAQAQWTLDLGSAETGLAVSDATSPAEQAARLVRIASYRSRAPPAGSHIS